MPVRGDRRAPTPAAAALLFATVLASNIALGILANTLGSGEDWLLLATPLMVLFWTCLASWYSRIDLKDALLLRLPSRADVIMAIPLALSFVILNDQLSSLTEDWIPREIQSEWLRIARISGPGEWAFKLSTIAVGAAVSEELMFRGFIQNAFLSSMRRSTAVLWTSFLFMMLHMLPLPSFAAAGLVLGFAALASRSIVVPILIHLLHNAAALALVNFTDLGTLGEPTWIPDTILLPAILIFALTIVFFAWRLAGEPTVAAEAVEAPPPSRVSSVSQELASISEGRRRLGWLVVAAAVILGASALLLLFGYTIYMTRPETLHAAVVERLAIECRARLAPEASPRAGELDRAFDSLASLNERGGLTFQRLWKIGSAYFEVSADGTIDANEVDRVLDAIGEAAEGTIRPRRL
jgi:membrane protease YdiL (CAAX protease family)